MVFVEVFLLAILFSSLGVLPPGMLNITAASISVNKSVSEAKKFILGATLVVLIQAFLGFYFATFLQSHPHVTKNLKLVGSVIFIVLTIFFLGKGVQNKINKANLVAKSNQTELNSFIQGILLSVINVFPVPYYGFIGLYFSAFIPNFFSTTMGIFYASGVATGTALVFYLYILLFKKMEHKIQFFVRNVNFIIALITGLFAFFTIYNL